MLKENTRVSFLHGVDSKLVEKLSQHGINYLVELLEACEYKKDREELADTVGVDYATIHRMANMTDLMRVRGVSDSYSDLLDRAGVDRVQGLRKYDPNDLLKKLVETSELHDIPHHFQKASLMKKWIDQAKKLPDALHDDAPMRPIIPEGHSKIPLMVLLALLGLILGWMILKFIINYIPGPEPMRTVTLLLLTIGLACAVLWRMIKKNSLLSGPLFRFAVYIPIILGLLFGSLFPTLFGYDGGDSDEIVINLPTEASQDSADETDEQDQEGDDSESEEVNEDEDDMPEKEEKEVTTFSRKDLVTRAHMAKILSVISEETIDESDTDCFSDITDVVEAKYICHAAKQEWVNGYFSGKFKPNKSVSKAEVSIMLSNFLQYELPENLEEDVYKDVSADDWYAKYIYAMKENDAIKEWRKFEPTSDATYGWVEDILKRVR